MKAFAFTLLLIAAAATADDLGTIVIETGDLPRGQARVLTFNDVTLTVTRNDQVRHVRVESKGIVNSFRIGPVDGELRVTWSDVSAGLIASDRKITVDGVTLHTAVTVIPPRGSATSRYFICPKDETVVRVGRGAPATGELLCPVDGTKMKAGAGPTNNIFLLQ